MRDKKLAFLVHSIKKQRKFQKQEINDLIYGFIMCSYFKMVENVKVGGLKFQKFLYFPYNTSFWKNCNCNSSRRFQEPIFGTPILN